ncbi:Protein SPA1-RELATED 4 [Glycine max]|nr:Protein SPA1-RELATED 4 [Glycine max]
MPAMPAIEDEQLLTSTMPTRRENTTLKMPGLLNTNEHHDRRTQTPDVDEEDDTHGENAARRTSTVGQAFLKPATTSRKQNERKKNATEAFPMPALSIKFYSWDPLSGKKVDESAEFITSVCWRSQSSTLHDTNSTGNIKILETT